MANDNKYLIAFSAASSKLRSLPIEPEAHEIASLQMVMDVAAKSYCVDFDGAEIYLKLKEELEDRGNIRIEEAETLNLDTYAKMEYSWTHERDFHRIVFRKGTFVNHRKVRELVKLKLEMDAMDADCHERFFVTDENHDRFLCDYLRTFVAKVKGTAMEKEITKAWNSLFYGLAKGVLESTTNMFAEDYIYHNFH